MKKIFTALFSLLFLAWCGYSQTPNTWAQKSEFPGSPRSGAVGFSIGSKGYIGTGDFPYRKDFWEYDPVTDAWTQKSDFGGDPRTGATAFSIGNKGYIGTGYKGYDAGTTYYKDFWEYDPDNNNWTQKTDFGGSKRYNAVGSALATRDILALASTFHFLISTMIFGNMILLIIHGRRKRILKEQPGQELPASTSVIRDISGWGRITLLKKVISGNTIR